MRVVLAALLLFAGLPLLTAAGPSAQLPAQVSEHERIVEFWTVERVAQAVPREFVYDPATGQFRQVHHRPGHPGGPPGGGNGNGDNGDDTVTGAQWTGGGTVTETTGKVLFEMNGSFYVCSAGVVEDGRSDASIVVTAAHCVYENSGSSPGFASNWMFIPNYDAQPAPLTTSGSFCEQTLHGCWTASALVVHDGFASAGGFNEQAILHDFAFAVLGPGGRDGNTLAESLGTQDIQFTDVAGGEWVHAFGYPHARPYDGTKLVYCAGGLRFDSGTSNQTYRLTCDMTGGASGGPWFWQFDEAAGEGTVMSVNSYRYRGGPQRDSIYGPKFNDNTKALYTEAHSATGNTVVP